MRGYSKGLRENEERNAGVDKEKQFLNIRQQIIGLESKFICKTIEMITSEEIKLDSKRSVDLTKYLI